MIKCHCLTALALALAASALVACDTRYSEVMGPDAVPGAAGGGDSVFADDFESGTLAGWSDGVDPTRHRVVTDPALAQSGQRYLAVTYPSGRDGGWLTRFFMPGYDALHVSYYVRFPSDWRGGTKLVALYGSRTDNQWSAIGKAGLCPNGSDFFAAMLVAEPMGDPGAVRFYTYYPGMAREPDGRTCWGRFGNGSETYSPPLTLTPGAWHHVEFRVHLNTPGRMDGRQTFSLDGAQRGQWTDIGFRDGNILRLNAVQLTFSVSDGVGRTQELYVDNLVVRAMRAMS
jgi:hypothetical protein